jgi:hypothetical protein
VRIYVICNAAPPGPNDAATIFRRADQWTG